MIKARYIQVAPPKYKGLQIVSETTEAGQAVVMVQLSEDAQDPSHTHKIGIQITRPTFFDIYRHLDDPKNVSSIIRAINKTSKLLTKNST